MRRLLLVLVVLGLLVSATGVMAQTNTVQYVVQRGDTLQNIAARYGTTWQAIAQLNNIPNPNVIYVGQVLLIPVGYVPPPPTQPPTGTTTIYHVVRGDTLALIAGWYGTTWQTLTSLNGLANPNLIFAGQTLRVPVAPNRTASYTVRWGDTLGTIAWRFSTTVGAITTRNGISNPNLIFTGQFLAIPY
ncbi:MAG: LysM peptidoglycan-binding domain-containing protein [Anaerolineae bacterium]